MPKKNNEFLILGSIIVGLFVLLGVTNVDFSSFIIEEAEATHEETEEEYPSVVRNATTLMTMFNEKHGVLRLGLPAHIEDNQGDYVASLFYEDANGIELESGSIAYYFDKNSCAMSLFNYGRINNTSVPIVKGDMWVVKVAPNGTDNWTDVSQNDLPCVVTTTVVSDTMYEINSTKSDALGTIQEMYHYDKYQGIKHDMWFTNNDPSLTNHKFSFSNILLDVPNSFMINIKGETVHDYFAENGIINVTVAQDQLTKIYNEIDLGIGIVAGDVLRTSTIIPVNPNDSIINATFLFQTNHTEHQAGNGTAILYDQNLNLLATSDEVAIPDNEGDIPIAFPFNPALQINTTSATSVFVGIFFGDSDGKVVTMMENAGTVLSSLSNTYPTAPDPFTDDSVYNSTNTFWTQLTINGLQPDVIAQHYSQYQPIDQNYRFGGLATVLETDIDGETIQYNASQFFDDDGTQINDGFVLLQKTSMPDPKISPILYSFVEGVEDLWAVKFVSNPDFTLDVYVDYANVTTTTPVGGSIHLDPIINFPSFADRTFGLNFGSTCGVSAGSSSIATTVGVAALTHSGASTVCSGTYVRYDITSIPDNAVPIRLTFQVNLTGGSISGSTATTIAPARIFEAFSEDLNLLSDAFFTLVARPVGGDFDIIDPISISSGFGNFPIGGLPANGQLRTVTITSVVSKALIDFEAQLDSGTNFVQYFICAGVSSGGCTGNGAVVSNSNAIVWERFGASFFEVEFEFFSVPDAPEPPITATFSVSPNKCLVDWSPPLNDGGRTLTGYQIERSTGGSFQVIQASVGTLPTDFEDTTITSGVSHTYRISAINLEGVGAASVVSNGCGFPELPSAPISLVATNVALGAVALEWSPPFFDGNSAITGYQVQRTFGINPVPPSAVWQLREQQVIGGAPTFFVFSATPPLEVDDIGALLSAGQAYVFKTFTKTDIQNKILNVTWSGSTTTGTFNQNRIYVLDGAYDRTSFTDFPSPAGLFITKGSGILSQFNRVSAYGTTSDLIPLTLTASVLDEVTILIAEFDSFAARQPIMDINSIEIKNYNRWSWDNPTSTVNMEVTGGDDDFGTTTAGSNVFDVNGVNEFFDLVADTGNALTEFIDTSVVVDTEYGYRIFAINAIGTSLNPSNVAIITTVGLPPPPLNVNAVATGTSTITVSWTAPDVGSSTIEGYSIDRKIGVGGIFTTINPFTGNDDTTFNDALLASGTEYCYRLKTFTNIGQSDTFSGESCATTQAQASPPQNLVATALDGSTINVTWDTPADDGGSPISGYKIERQKEALAFEILFAERQPESNRIFLDTGREVGTQYTYRISAVTGFGVGVAGQATATTDATPTPPQNFACSPASTTAINLSWDTPLSFSPATGYQIDRKSVGGSFSTIVADTGTTETTFLNDGLTVDSIFVYRVLGKTAEGDTDFTPEITCSTLSAPDSPPENVRGDFSEVIPHQTVLAWDIPDTFGIPITEFRIERDDGAGYLEIGSVSGSSVAFIDQQLDSDIDQRYRVITVGSEGETVESIAIPFDTNQRSHWHYEGTIDDTGVEKNTGTVFGTANFNGTGHIGKAFIFNSTRIEVDQTQESDYDFDLNQGFGITTFFDGTQSVGSGLLTQNNTFSFTSATLDGRSHNNGANTIQCDSQTTAIKDTTSNTLNMRVGRIDLASFCIKVFGEWDISTIANSTNTVTSVEFRADVTGELANTRSCTFASLELQPSVATAIQLYNDIGDGTDFLTNVGNPMCDDPALANNVVVDLGSLAVTNLQSAFDAGQSWWGLGIQFTDQVRIVETEHLLTFLHANPSQFELRVNYTTAVLGGTPVFTDEWQIKEQQVLGANDSGCSMSASATDLNVDISFAGLSHCQLFKVFNKADIIGKTLDVTWAGSSNIGIQARIDVLDGAYDRDNPIDFPLNVGSIGFREGIGSGLVGGGLLHSIVNGGTSFATITDSILMTLAGSELPQVTIVVKIRDGSAANSVHLDIEKIEIVGLDSWTWDSSSSVTAVFDSADFNSGVANANFTGNTLVAGGAGSTDQVIVSKAETLTDVGYKFYIDATGLPSVKLTNTNVINEIFVQSPVNVTDSTIHFIGFGYNGNQSASGVSWNVDGNTNATIITDTLSGSILNNFPLTIGGTSTGTNLLNGTLDETRFFGSGTLDQDQLDEIENDKLDTVAPINATMTISGSTFANISGEVVIINLTSGFPLPVIGVIALDNFTATEVNAIVPVGTIDPITGLFVFDRFFNIMGSLSNYTADTTLTNAFEAFPLLSNFDIQSPVFTFTGDFFFQQARNPTFDVLSFNFTQTDIPFDLTCNLKSRLFGNGTTFAFTDVFFIQELFDVDPFLDVVVACIDPSTPPVDPTAPSFGGSNALLSFVSFGDTTGIGNFLNFTENFGDFFGAGLPFLFIIILAAAFTGRSAPTGIIIIGVCLGVMWFLGIIEQDPIMWGIIIVLIVLGALAGKKFL